MKTMMNQLNLIHADNGDFKRILNGFSGMLGLIERVTRLEEAERKFTKVLLTTAGVCAGIGTVIGFLGGKVETALRPILKMVAGL